jgi:hypothetical protein
MFVLSKDSGHGFVPCQRELEYFQGQIAGQMRHSHQEADGDFRTNPKDAQLELFHASEAKGWVQEPDFQQTT